MKKRIFPILIFLVITLFTGCKQTPENRVDPPFFKVIDSETGGTVYMLGTMHVGLPNTVYSDEIYAALDECETLAVEIDLLALNADRGRLNDAMKILECNGETAADFLGEDYETIKKAFVKKKLYNANYERYIPAVWSSVWTNTLAEDCGYRSDLGTDRVMLSYAKKNSKKIYEIESIEEQYRINANEPRALQVYLLKSSAETDVELQKDQLRELYRAWSESDFSALVRMISEDEAPAELSEEYAAFYFEMYENRQKKMAEYIVNCLKNGEKVFVAVGAMHYFASPDILDLLADEGYEVQVVQWTVDS